MGEKGGKEKGSRPLFQMSVQMGETVEVWAGQRNHEEAGRGCSASDHLGKTPEMMCR